MKKYKYKNDEYTLMEISDMTGIRYSTVYGAIIRRGKSVEEFIDNYKKYQPVEYRYYEHEGRMISTPEMTEVIGVPYKYFVKYHKQMKPDEIKEKYDKHLSSELQLTCDGETHTLNEWAKIRSIPYGTIYSRFTSGMTPNEILKESKGMKKITIDGITDTISGWCDRTGISPELIRTLHWQGVEGKELISQEPMILTVNGQTKDLLEWSNMTGINPSELYQRHRKGLDPEDIIDPEYDPKKDKKRMLTYQGKTMTIGDWARETGLAYSTIYHRYSRSDDPEFILKKNVTEVTMNGETKSVREWCRIYDVGYRVASRQLNKGKSPEEVFGESFQKVELNGEVRSLREWADILDIPYHTLRTRKINGQPLDAPLRQPKTYFYNGEEKTLQEWADEINIPYTVLYRRIRAGKTIKEALKKPKTIRLTFDGQTHTLLEWGKITGKSYTGMKKRYEKGMTAEQVIYGRKGRDHS